MGGFLPPGGGMRRPMFPRPQNPGPMAPGGPMGAPGGAPPVPKPMDRLGGVDPIGVAGGVPTDQGNMGGAAGIAQPMIWPNGRGPSRPMNPGPFAPRPGGSGPFVPTPGPGGPGGPMPMDRMPPVPGGAPPPPTTPPPFGTPGNYGGYNPGGMPAPAPAPGSGFARAETQQRMADRRATNQARFGDRWVGGPADQQARISGQRKALMGMK